MKLGALLILLLVVGFGIGLFAQEEPLEAKPAFCEGFTLAFSYRTLFLDTDKWNAMIPRESGLPELDGYVRFHGATVAVPVSGGLHFGMSGYGANLNSLNENGYTTWKGAIAGLSLESVGQGTLEALYQHLGLALYCGTFTFSATGVNGTGICGYGGAFYLEPSVGLSHQIGDKLFVMGRVSTLLSFFPGNGWPEGRDTGENITPDGLMLTFTVGWRGLNW